MDSQGGARGPFRATQLWRELSACFRARMPLTTHWQRFKRRDNCFTAREAVDWLHQHLINNSNFGPEVTRQQAVKLLRKFLQSHVIEDVQGRWGSEHLEDNKKLFRFPTTSLPQTVPPSHPELSKSSFQEIAEKKKSLFQLPGYLAEFLRSMSIR